MSPRVSVVIPALNAEATLPQALDSLAGQSLADWEAVVVDDGSSDGTLDRAQRLGRHDRRIRVVSQAHAGASAARNTGIGHARAAWLVFLDSDDWLAPDHLARLSEALGANDATVACCGYARVRPDGSTIAVEPCADIADQPFDAFAHRSAAAIHCFMVQRDLVLEVGGFDTTLATCEDWDLWQRIARAGARFVAVAATLAFYRMRQDSLSGSRRRMVQDAVEVISRAHGPDARVRTPLPAYAHGTADADRDESAALFAVWCAAAEAAKGHDASSLLEEIPRVPDLSTRVEALCGSIRRGMVVGGLLLPTEISAAWPRTSAHLASTLARIEEAAACRGFAYHVRSTLERKILADESLHEPIALTAWMGVRADLRQRCSTIAPPPGIDAVDCRICAGDRLLGRIEIPVFGAIAAGTLAGAVVETLGWRAVVTHGKLLWRLRFWMALLVEGARAVPAFGRGPASRRAGERAALRSLVGDVLRATTRLALTAAERPLSVATSASRAERIVAEERAAARATSTQSATVSAGAVRTAGHDAQPVDRKAYWEKTFEAPDPWGYESVYETHKYAQTLSLLDDGPIDRALELGCAEGIFTQRLAPRVGHLIAADISERALDRARSRCRGSQNIDFRQIDFFDEAIPGEMDLIVCSEVLYFLGDRARLAVVAEKLASALAPGGRLVTAHAFLLADDPTRTGFDWDHPFGATTIGEAFQAAGLTREQSIRTDLYRVDLFRSSGRLAHAGSPAIRTEPFGSPLAFQVERGVVWGGAVVRQVDVASIDTIHVPVLVYHRIADDGPASLSDYRVSPHLFEEQMRFLRRHGFHTVSSADLERHRRERRPMRGRPVLITFDDGYRDFYETAWPILRRVGFTAEVFLPTDFIGGTADWDRPHGPPAAIMSWEDIGVAHAEGVRFGSHLASHASAHGLNTDTLLREGARSRAILERRLGGEIRSVAPPFGACDERVVRVLHLCGFTQMFTTEPGPAALDGWSATVPRIAISGRDTIQSFATKLGVSAPGQDTAETPLVAAVVPAFNAEKTIDETLRSVRAQTYRHLEILVIDDGSTDTTAARVEAHARVDARVRLIRKANAGVASARNRGIAEATADFIAPVDADDLWMPTKIEKQMAAMLSRGPRCGLVYTWQTTIDGHGRVIASRRRWEAEGHVLPRMLFGNLVGSGSPALIRKHAIIEAGGYDTSLLERGAQGCEDFKLYLQISERHEFAVIREYLTGYRARPDAMSMDLLQMVRSHDLVAAYAERAHPHHTPLIRAGQIYFRQNQLRTAVRHRQYRVAVLLLLELLKNYPWQAAGFLLEAPRLAIRYAVRSATGAADHAPGTPIPFLPQLTDTSPGTSPSGLSARNQGGSVLVTSK